MPSDSVRNPNQSSLPGIARRLGQENRRAGKRQQAERHVDIKNIAPAQVLGHVAADRRTDERTERRGHAPKRHGLGLLFGWIRIEDDRVR